MTKDEAAKLMKFLKIVAPVVVFAIASVGMFIVEQIPLILLKCNHLPQPLWLLIGAVNGFVVIKLMIHAKIIDEVILND